ncbi:hypothetical protein G6F42_025146 [Rhizopus arrhizus]|nr:hypothetical protein G6F42_025146 [Rhizopus arrhizus]
MLLSKIALSVLAIAGVCSASDRFMIRSPTSSRLLGFSYEKKPFWGDKCEETYDKYLKVQSSGKGVHFKLTGCDDNDYCHLAITDGDYEGYCLSGDKRPESQSLPRMVLISVLAMNTRMIALISNTLNLQRKSTIG